MLDTDAIAKEMFTEASRAAREFADARFDGRDGGACGFAWVEVYPESKGNTKQGKIERAVLKAMGFRQDWTGKAYQVWDPANWPGQSIDCKEAGATAAAEVLRKYGFRAYAGSRLD
jgi:hypothetical protein